MEKEAGLNVDKREKSLPGACENLNVYLLVTTFTACFIELYRSLTISNAFFKQEIFWARLLVGLTVSFRNSIM